MNREQKRMMQRQGQVGADGTPAPRRASTQDVSVAVASAPVRASFSARSEKRCARSPGPPGPRSSTTP